MLPLKIVMTQKKFVHPDIMTLRKCTTFKCLAKINSFPCFISMHVLLIKSKHLLNSTKKSFDIIAIGETRITKQASLSNNLNLSNYSFEFTPTETSAGGTFLYIANHLSYKCHNDLYIYKKINWNLLLLRFSTRGNQTL